MAVEGSVHSAGRLEGFRRLCGASIYLFTTGLLVSFGFGCQPVYRCPLAIPIACV